MVRFCVPKCAVGVVVLLSQFAASTEPSTGSPPAGVVSKHHKYISKHHKSYRSYVSSISSLSPCVDSMKCSY